MATSGGYPYVFALDYNRLNNQGEPVMLCVRFDDEAVAVEKVADSFAAFLKGQYQGDETPEVKLEEADKYELIGEGEYCGHLPLLDNPDAPVRVSWKICSHKRQLVVYKKTSFNGKDEFEKATFLKSKLVSSFVPLSESGLEIEPELAELIQHAVEPEILVHDTAYKDPDCHRLDLHIDPNDVWIELQQSTSFEGRWKNSASRVLYVSVFSSDRAFLQRTFQTLIGICGD